MTRYEVHCFQAPLDMPTEPHIFTLDASDSEQARDEMNRLAREQLKQYTPKDAVMRYGMNGIIEFTVGQSGVERWELREVD